jgi:hypothetical protein
VQAVRLLIYGMQSSGASTLALLLAQKPRSVGLIDIWAMYAAPRLDGAGDVVAKVVVTTTFPLSMHQARFQPDRTILVLRHPGANHRSLGRREYRHHCGFMEEKFQVLDEVFASGKGFDTVIHYEDLVFDPPVALDAISALGWSCEPDFLSFKRSFADIVSFNTARHPNLSERLQFGMGQHHDGGIGQSYAGLSDTTMNPDVRAWCPNVAAHYDLLMFTRADRWRADHASAPVPLGRAVPGSIERSVGESMRDDFRRALATEPSDRASLADFAERLRSRGRLREARIVYEQILLRNPNDLAVLSSLTDLDMSVSG